MVCRHGRGQRPNTRRYERIVARWNSRLKKERCARSHFVMVCEHIGPPGIVLIHARTALRMLQGHPIPVKVEPVVIGSSSGPWFMVFPRNWRRAGDAAFVGVHPSGEP